MNLGFYNSVDADRYSLDLTLFKELEHFFTVNPTVIHCFNILDRFLFQNVEVQNSEKLLSDFINDHIVKFFSNVLKYLLILGWCPYSYKTVKDSYTGKDVSIPYIIPITYIHTDLIVNKRLCTHEFVFTDLDQLTVRKNIKVIIGTDIENLVNPTLIYSPLNSILSEVRILEQMRKFMIQGEFIRSNPAIFLKKAVVTKKTNETDADEAAVVGSRERPYTIDNSGRLGWDKPSKNKVDRVESLHLASKDIMSNVEFHNQQMSDMTRYQNDNYYNTGLSFLPQTSNNLFICPPDMDLAATPRLPETRVDVIIFEKKLASSIFLVLGIPETVFGFGSHMNVTSQGRTANRSTEIRSDMTVMDINGFESTLNNFIIIFTKLFVTLYFDIFKKKLLRSAIRFKAPEIYEKVTEIMVAEIMEGDEAQPKNKPKKAKK